MTVAPERVLSRRGRCLPLAVYERLARLVQQGLSAREIARQVGVSRHTIDGFIQRGCQPPTQHVDVPTLRSERLLDRVVAPAAFVRRCPTCRQKLVTQGCLACFLHAPECAPLLPLPRNR